MKVLSSITDDKDLVSKEYADASRANVLKSSVSVAEDNTSSLNIPFAISDISSLSVYQNGILLSPSVHYNATTSSITLIGYTASAGDIFTFVGNATTSTDTASFSASAISFSDTTENGCYEGCSNVQEALNHIPDIPNSPPVVTIAYAASVEIQANKLSEIAQLSGNITITLAAGITGYDNEWAFTIAQGATAYTVTLPTITWIGEAPTFAANKITETRLFYISSTLCGVAMSI